MSWSIGGSMIVAVVVVIVAVILNRTLLPWFVRQIVPRGNREIPILLSLTVCLGATWGASKLELSPAFGAFVAGMFLAGTPYAVQVRAEMGPLRTVFVALFFASIGMYADPRWMANNLTQILAFVFVLLVVKTALTWLSCLVMRRGNRAAFATGVTLCQGGEFGFVLGGMALATSVFSRDTFMLMASVILVSLMVTPTLVKNAVGLAGWWEGRLVRVGLIRERTGVTEPPGDDTKRVIVVGFGPIGQRVCVRLVEAGVEPLVVDANPQNMISALRLGYQAEVGDASLSEVLEHLHLERVLAVVVTIPDLAAARAVTAHVRDMAPLVPVFARARYHVHALLLYGCGVEEVVDEEMESGAILGDRVLTALGLDIPSGDEEMDA